MQIRAAENMVIDFIRRIAICLRKFLNVEMQKQMACKRRLERFMQESKAKQLTI